MTPAIQDLLERLKSLDRNKRLEAINAAGYAALKGEDIGAASGELNRALSDEDGTIRTRAAWALTIHYLQAGNVEAVKKLSEIKDENIIYGMVQSLGAGLDKGIDISPLTSSLENVLTETMHSSLRNEAAEVLARFYFENDMVRKAIGMLKHKDKNVRSRAVASYMRAAMNGADISPLLHVLKEALEDKEQEVKHYAANALVKFHAQRKQWKEIDELLANKDPTVRYSAIADLQTYVESFDIRSDIPNILKALEDNNFDVRKGVVSLLKMAAEKGLDISFAVPALKKAAMYGSKEIKEAAENVLKEYELRKNAGQRCRYCLDCENGLGAGNQSKSLEDVATIVKEISCCGGDVTHRIFRCKRCDKYYLSSYYDHKGFEAEQFFVVLVEKADAAKLVEEIRKCKEPENPNCSCEVHTVLLKHDAMPIKGVTKYKAKID